MIEKVLISVLNYNNFPSTKKCILSLLKLDYSNFQILIIDNKSTDNSYEKFIGEFPSLKILLSISNGGYAAGHKISVNYAIENNFDLIWILNNDLTVRENTLLELFKAYKKHGLGLYGSITLKSESPDVINFGGGIVDDISKPFNYNSFENKLHEKQKKDVRKVQTIEGSSFLIPLTTIKKYGFLRTDFFMYVEEVDYCYDLKRKGIDSYIVPNSLVIHKGAESFKGQSYLEKYYRRRNMLYFEKKNYNISIIKNINKRTGWISLVKFFFKFFFFSGFKDELYFLNLANIHALINKKGKF